MASNFAKSDFIIKDLVISVGGGTRGGTWLPGPDQEIPPSPISPIASIAVNIDLIEIVRLAVQEAVKEKNFDSIGRAFAGNPLSDVDPDGSVAIQAAIREIGTAVVASAVYAALGGSEVGLVDPDRSFETIPTSITPIVRKGFEVHRVAELPRLKRQLAEAVAFVDRAIEAQTPQDNEVANVREQLETALRNLPCG